MIYDYSYNYGCVCRDHSRCGFPRPMGRMIKVIEDDKEEIKEQTEKGKESIPESGDLF